MRKFFSIIAILAFGAVASFAQNDAITRFFESYEDNEEFTSVYVSPRMFEMVAKVASEEMEGDLADVVRNLKGLQVLRTDKNPLKYYKEAVSKIPTNEYEMLVKVKDEGQNVRIFSKSKGDIVNELLVMVGGTDEFLLLSFVGDIDLNKLAKIAKDLDIDGVENLELIGN